MKKFVFLTLAISSPLFAHRVVYEEIAAAPYVVVEQAPPAEKVETITVSPGPNYIWLKGYWKWENSRWAWSNGHWAIRPHASAVWHPGHWDAKEHGWVWVEGHWD